MSRFETTSNTTSSVIGYNEPSLNPWMTAGVWATCPLLAIYQDPSLGSVYYDDFRTFRDEDGTELRYDYISDGGLDALPNNAANGTLYLAVNGPPTSNEYSQLFAMSKGYKFATNKEMWFETSVKGNSAGSMWEFNFATGMSSTIGVEMTQDSDAGLIAEYHGAVFYKVQDDMMWYFQTNNGDRKTTSQLGGCLDNDFQRLGWKFNGTTTITPYLDGKSYASHELVIGNMDDVGLFWEIKNNDAAPPITSMAIDYVKIAQIR